MITRIQKWGNSLALRIPKSFAVEIGLYRETAVDVSLVNGKLLITPVAEANLRLENLLSRVTEENIHREINTGPAAGNEAW